MRIKGGYILLSRKIDGSDTMKLPPATREVWLYILRKVNHSEYKNLKRGENIFRYKEIQDDLSWYAGYRKISYSKNDIAKSIRRLHERHMIETTKATRGVIIKVVNYDIYQDPKSYEGYKEDTAKDLRKTQGVSTKYKNVYKKNKNERENNSIKLLREPELWEELSLKFNTNRSYIEQECEKMEDWLRSKGKRQNDYKAFARNWIRRATESQRKEYDLDRTKIDRGLQSTRDLLNQYNK